MAFHSIDNSVRDTYVITLILRGKFHPTWRWGEKIGFTSSFSIWFYERPNPHHSIPVSLSLSIWFFERRNPHHSTISVSLSLSIWFFERRTSHRSSFTFILFDPTVSVLLSFSFTFIPLEVNLGL